MGLLNANERVGSVTSISRGAFGHWGGWIERVKQSLAVRHERTRRLRTVLFTDIVGSTIQAAEMGDRQWVEVLRNYYAIVRKELTIFRGHEIETAGDGFLATFEAPTQAIRCASAIRDEMATLGLQIKAGLHAGECESLDNSIAGIAVHIGARVVDMARPGELLVSSTVKELVMGSGIAFVDHGMHRLKGLSGEWRLFLIMGESDANAGVAPVVPVHFKRSPVKTRSF